MSYYVEAGNKKGKFFKSRKASKKQSKIFSSRAKAESYAKKKLKEGRPIAIDKLTRTGQRPLLVKGDKDKRPDKVAVNFGRFSSSSKKKKR